MKHFYAVLAVLLALVFLGGCVSPAEDYVRADAACWGQYDKDGRIDRWIEEAESKGRERIESGQPLVPGELSMDEADALRKLNAGRRARVGHAMRSIREGRNK